MTAPAAYTGVLDATDNALIALLRADGRQPFRALAQQLSISEAAVSQRVKRLEEEQFMRVVAVTDSVAAGFPLLVAVGVQVSGAEPASVARALAQIPAVFSVSVVVGVNDLELLVAASDQQALVNLLSQQLAVVPGVRRIFPALALEVQKNQPDWVPFHSVRAGDLDMGGSASLDVLDQKVLSLLAHDARTSNSAIAQQLDVTEGTVRSRIKRMEAKGQMRITAVTNINRLMAGALAYIWIEVEQSGDTANIARQLSQLPELGFVAVMLGRSDILVITSVRDNAHLAAFLHQRINSVSGVRVSDSSLTVDFVKHDYRMARIVERQHSTQ